MRRDKRSNRAVIHITPFFSKTYSSSTKNGPKGTETKDSEGYPSASSKSETASKQQRRQLEEILSSARTRANEWSDSILARLGLLGTHINQVTGYEEIEKLKHHVIHKEEALRKARESAKAAKTAYDQAITSRSTSQSAVNSLLERKHSWTDSDIANFTSLIRSDHNSNLLVSQTSSALDTAETEVDKAFSELTRAILDRYHEEQIWSDKIRNVSTYFGIGGLVLNLIVFVGAIAIVEPWKRRRLVEGLEERVGGMMDSVEKRIEALGIEVAFASAVDRLVDEEKGGEEILVDLPGSSEDEMLAVEVGSRGSYFGIMDNLIPPSMMRDVCLAGAAGVTIGVVAMIPMIR